MTKSIRQVTYGIRNLLDPWCVLLVTVVDNKISERIDDKKVVSLTTNKDTQKEKQQRE